VPGIDGSLVRSESVVALNSGQWLLLLGFTVLAAYALFILALVIAGRREATRALAGFIPDCVVLFRRLLADRRVPRRHKVLLAALVGYLACPIDLVPDFIPVAGQLDDAIIVGVALRVILRGSRPDLVREHWPGPASSLRVILGLAGHSGQGTAEP
jgi:uncharacterized membrane protein YkvA (DUF1232 family)